MLKAAFVQGRMRKDEFDARVDQTFASRTYAELAAITADIPAGQIGDQPPRPGAQVQAWTPAAAPARTPGSHAAKARRFMIIGVTMMVLFVMARGAPALLFLPLGLTAFVLAECPETRRAARAPRAAAGAAGGTAPGPADGSAGG